MKKISAVFCLLTLIGFNSCYSATAQEIECSNVPAIIEMDQESEFVPFADIIVRKYRLHDGVRQYRRWNETRGYWVDPYWINM